MVLKFEINAQNTDKTDRRAETNNSVNFIFQKLLIINMAKN